MEIALGCDVESMRVNQVMGSSTFWSGWQQLPSPLAGGVGIIYVTLLLACSDGGNSSGGGSGVSNSGPTGKLGTAMAYSTNGLGLTQVVLADLNGDGRKDIVTISDMSYGAMLAIYYQDKFGQFNTGPPINGYVTYNFASFGRISVGDLNNDGRADLVLTGQCIRCIGGYQFVVIYQDPVTGNLLPGQTFFGAGGSAAIADINSDGRNDFITNNASGTVSIFYQLQNGSLGAEFVYDKITGFVRGEIHIGDMDNDGDNDIIVQSNIKQLAIIKQDSDIVPGILTDTPEYYDVQTTNWPMFDAFAVGDLNGDGKNDVVVLDPGNNGTMNVFLQNKNGKLDPPILTVPWFAPPYGVEIADINGDELNDILGDQVNPGVPAMGNVYVLYQAPDHTFQSPIAYSFPTRSGGGSAEHERLAVGDVTGDGKPDAVMTWQDEGVFVLPNTSP